MSLVDLARDRVVDDVARLDALVVGLEPGVDPERLDADDLLLLVAHRAGHVHHVDDDGVASAAAASSFQRAVPLVLADRDDDRVARVVRARARSAACSASLVGALEVAQRLGPGAGGCRCTCPWSVTIFFLPCGSMRGSCELLAEDLGQLLEREVDFEDVLARLARRPAPSPGCGSPWPSGVARRRPRPGRRRPALARRSGTAGCRSAAAGCETRSLPFLPIISPC